jgi:hypothetical protein
MFYELDLVAFTGSSNNQKYHNKKLVLWDNNKKSILCTTQFKSDILSLKVLKKLIIAATKLEINICNFNDFHNIIEIIYKIPVEENTLNPCYDIWMGNNRSKYFIAHVKNKSQIEVLSIYENSLEIEIIKNFSSEFDEIQNIFYNEKLNSLFVVDRMGSYIKGFCCENFSRKYEFYRGKNFAYISSIISMYDKYVVISSNNKTIHIYEISPNEIEKNYSKSYLGSFYNFFTNPYKLNKSVIKINLDESEEFDFFDNEFRKKGCLLTFSQNDHILNCLSYNGINYQYKINFDSLTYDLVNRINWCFDDSNKDSITISNDFCFDLVSTSKNKLSEEEEETNWKII